jgi:HEAT repeat protein
MSREGTDRLMDALLVNDRQEVYDGEVEMVEPKRAIRELARRRGSVVRAMVPLVERYESEKECRNYIDYVVEVLGRIGTERALELITRVLLAALENGDDCADTCVAWLREAGETAVPVLIRFVEANYRTEMAVFHAVAAMKGTKDERLVPALSRMLEYPDPAVIASALDRLREQDDGSVVPQVAPLLGYSYRRAGEQRGVREAALRALVRLLRDDGRRLHDILVEHGIVRVGSAPAGASDEGHSGKRAGHGGGEDDKRDDDELPPSLMDGLVRSYNEELTLEGDGGPRGRRASRPARPGGATATDDHSEALPSKVAMMLFQEGLIPQGQLEMIRRRCESLDESAKDVVRGDTEILWTAGFDVFVSQAEKRADAGRVERLRSVLEGEGFAVTSERGGGLLARSKGRSVIIIDSRGAEDGKKEGDHWSGFSIRLLGDWDKDEAVAMLEQLWRMIERVPAAAKLVGTPW